HGFEVELGSIRITMAPPWQIFDNTDYVLEGSEGTPFAGGYYYGKIKFPQEYPYKPPGISMTTPNGSSS
ncbi:ubiquitin-conjugating enzyme E2 34-like, partial [Trifolium medium]|nr:ubiquitin-conjugating enzyme E2 34-like [Trifolium medium]